MTPFTFFKSDIFVDTVEPEITPTAGITLSTFMPLAVNCAATSSIVLSASSVTVTMIDFVFLGKMLPKFLRVATPKL